MWTIPNSTTGEAKTAGYEQQLQDLREVLIREYEQANEVFMLFRQSDSRYQDPRTDYTLGRRDAIDRILQQVLVAMQELNK
jgi:hypothetical protein